MFRCRWCEATFGLHEGDKLGDHVRATHAEWKEPEVEGRSPAYEGILREALQLSPEDKIWLAAQLIDSARAKS